MAGGHGGMVHLGPVTLKETNWVERNFYRWVTTNPVAPLPGAVPGPALALAPHVFPPGYNGGLHAALRLFLPAFYGVEQVTDRIIVENLAHGLANPRFLDVKIGARTCSEQELIAAGRDAPSAWWKKHKLKIADTVTLSDERGFRVVAATGFPPDRTALARREPDTVYQGFFGPAPGGGAGPPAGLRQIVANQVEGIRVGVNWGDYAMIAASVLIVIGVAGGGGGWVSRVKLIDFAHSYHRDAGSRGAWSVEQFRKYSSNFSQGLAAFSISISPVP